MEFEVDIIFLRNTHKKVYYYTYLLSTYVRRYV